MSQADKHHWGTDGAASAEVNNSGSDPNDSDDDDSVNDEKSEKEDGVNTRPKRTRAIPREEQEI